MKSRRKRRPNPLHSVRPSAKTANQLETLYRHTPTTGLFRLDYRFNDKSTSYVRYNIDEAYIDSPTDALGSRNVIPHTPQNLVLQFQHIFSPSLVNETRFGLNRANYRNYSYGTSPISVDTGGLFDTITDNTLDEEVGTTFSRPFLNKRGIVSTIFGGWELSGLLTASTGRPVNITLNRSANQLPDGNTASQRPDLVPGVPIYAAHRTIGDWFNPAAFAVPAPGT
jgi:hypothetical protein